MSPLVGLVGLHDRSDVQRHRNACGGRPRPQLLWNALLRGQ